MKLIKVSHEKCVGCRLCEFVCSLVHDDECSTSRSRIRVHRDEEFGNNLVSLCLQCEETHCMESCVYDSIRRDEKTGAVLIDDEKCVGCETCVSECPVSAVFYDSEKNKAFKCDLCGGDPECVKWCSRDALTLEEADITSPDRKALMDETTTLLSKKRKSIR
ncbi:MAG: 4Fe-4S dicluster domain-containing protein [Dehalococcoidia bacterium]|nr:4Fe-4S dicluster domain-containing protein [Dehalococcoidia bacterium]